MTSNANRVRSATLADIPGMHAVRMSVRENRLTSSVIGERDYVPYLQARGRGWVIERDGRIVAFAIANAEDGNIWALFVHPDHEGRGYGRALQAAMLDWLGTRGVAKLWLTTEAGTRAERFYERSGWRRVGGAAAGETRFERGPLPPPLEPGQPPEGP